jgi:sec-independent protein translocase protein TatC
LTFEPDDTPVGESLASAVQDPMGVLEHLNALRIHLTRAVIALAITTALSFTFVEPIMQVLATPIDGGLKALRSIDPTETISMVMRIALLAGFALAFPYIAFEVWLFIAPGVSAKTRRFGLLAIPLTTLFFLFGMAFAFYIMLPVAMPFLFTFMGIPTDPRPATYFPFVVSLMFWIGMAFEFPLVIYILARLKMVTARNLAQQWRYAVVVIALLAAIITPTTDPVNMALVMLPMSVLYGLSIILAYLARRGEAVAESAA